MAIAITQQFELEECCNCGIAFAVTADFQRRRRDYGGSFHCPRGHAQSYSETELSRLKKELAQETHRAEQKEAALNRARGMLKHTEASLRATKGAHTKTKKRIANGVCPCCNRTFVNLKRHMNGQHPDYAA